MLSVVISCWTLVCGDSGCISPTEGLLTVSTSPLFSLLTLKTAPRMFSLASAVCTKLQALIQFCWYRCERCNFNKTNTEEDTRGIVNGRHNMPLLLCSLLFCTDHSCSTMCRSSNNLKGLHSLPNMLYGCAVRWHEARGPHLQKRLYVCDRVCFPSRHTQVSGHWRQALLKTENQGAASAPTVGLSVSRAGAMVLAGSFNGHNLRRFS